MKDFLGSPGTWSGFALRSAQCSFAAASVGVMASANSFSNYTAFWYLSRLLFIVSSIGTVLEV